MLPIERKNEFLRYIMITESYDEWSKVVYVYMINKNIKNWKEGFDFVVKHSDDPPWAAYLMARRGHAEPEWAMKVIENATIGDPSWVAYCMLMCKYVKPEWVMKVIENDTIGEPSHFACFMARDGYATQEWFEEIRRKNNVSS